MPARTTSGPCLKRESRYVNPSSSTGRVRGSPSRGSKTSTSWITSAIWPSCAPALAHTAPPNEPGMLIPQSNPPRPSRAHRLARPVIDAPASARTYGAVDAHPVGAHPDHEATDAGVGHDEVASLAEQERFEARVARQPQQGHQLVRARCDRIPVGRPADAERGERSDRHVSFERNAIALPQARRGRRAHPPSRPDARGSPRRLGRQRPPLGHGDQLLGQGASRVGAAQPACGRRHRRAAVVVAQ